jgi:lipoprotein-anchoring transpeptidase ErfK/SrfK
MMGLCLMRFSTVMAAAALAALLAGCNGRPIPDPALSARDAEWMALVPDAPENPNVGRYLVDYTGAEVPGTVVVDTKERQLFLVMPDRKAIRYGVAVGDEAYGWTGSARIARKAEWPSWNPPGRDEAALAARAAHGRRPANPLGARALYLFDGNRDTLYRIHGTNEPEKIGQAVSSGCIRMRNIDVVDLYNRVQPNATVIVR